MLTRKQRHLLLFLREKLSESGVCPSFDEMREALNLKSKSGVHRMIRSLEERGFIRRLPNRARALEVLRLPQAAASPEVIPEKPEENNSKTMGASSLGPGSQAGSQPGSRPISQPASQPRHEPALGGSTTQGAQGSTFSPAPPSLLQPATVSPFRVPEGTASPSDFSIPLYGRIAAGTPVTALRDETERIHVPPGMLGSGSYYALEVRGDSMIDVGIFEGDIAVIHHCDRAENHQIVVALIDQEEVTLKRYLRKGKTIALEAANSAYETRIFGEERIRIQGRLALLLRRYR